MACGNCGAALRVLQLAGHYGTTVEIDLCEPCHLVWFDVVESAQLSGPGLLDLIAAMAAAQTLAHLPLRPDTSCPRCRGRLRTVHNRTRWGPSLQIECVRHHGAWQTFAQFLSEKGLLRAMSSADRARALQRDGVLHCVNCGGEVAAGDQVCRWCTSVPALVDVARLARALDPEGATLGFAVHGTAAAALALSCQACGAALPAESRWLCRQCGATLTAPGLAQAHRQVAPLRDALQQHAKKPSPAIVQQRLQQHAAGLQRQRERAAQMQAEADSQHGGGSWPRGMGGDPDDDGVLADLLDRAPRLRLPPWSLALAAALLAAWWLW